jgi:hypothetical protein
VKYVQSTLIAILQFSNYIIFTWASLTYGHLKLICLSPKWK